MILLFVSRLHMNGDDATQKTNAATLANVSKILMAFYLMIFARTFVI